MSEPDYLTFSATAAAHAAPDAPQLAGHDADTVDHLLSWYESRSQPAPPIHFSEDNYFNDAYRASLSPPPPNFLDNILNPAGLDHHRCEPLVCRSPPRPSPAAAPQTYSTADGMSPSTRSRPQGSQRPARLPNGYVDLTAAPDSPPQRRKRQSPTPGPSAKRHKRADGTPTQRESIDLMKAEDIDPTDDRQSLQERLLKQRADTLKSQTKVEEQPPSFNTITCVICMDNPTDLTATACGHLFCHTCLMEALIAGENRAGPGERKQSQCPVCRKFINRSKSTDIIPLLLKKGLASQPRKKATALPAAVAPKPIPQQPQPPPRKSTRRVRRPLDDLDWV